MPTEERENELRRAFASAAAGYPHPERAQQRLLQRNYRPGRGHRKLIAGSIATAAAGSVALALSLAGVIGATPSRGTGTTGTAASAGNSGTTGTAAPARGTGTIRTAAFTLTSNANGTDTLTFKLAQVLDPAGLQRALAQHHVPALVKTDASCASTPAPPDPSSIGVVSVREPAKPHLRAGQGPRGVAPGTGAVKQLMAHTVMVINSAAIPSGTELAFNFSSSDNAFAVNLVNIGSHTCRTGQSPATPGGRHNHQPLG
jgi:hypothetical protein